MDSVHKTVLLNETIDNLNLNNHSVVVDATFGGGGHTLQMCKNYPDIKVFAIDQDKGAFKKAENKFKGMKCDIKFINANFRQIGEQKDLKEFDAIMFDLGLSSDQLENSLRGFSFMKDEPLLMTMKENPGRDDVTAYAIVNTWEEKSLVDIIYGYGEEKFARRIAKGIVEARSKGEIKTTFDLVKIIESSVPAVYRKGKINCATRTFQALRIAVNDELGALGDGLQAGFDGLKNGGRMAVISFHSLEDRIVKRFFRECAKEGKAILINKKPITPTKEEIINNNRSRSAKLRVLQKITA